MATKEAAHCAFCRMKIFEGTDENICTNCKQKTICNDIHDAKQDLIYLVRSFNYSDRRIAVNRIYQIFLKIDLENEKRCKSCTACKIIEAIDDLREGIDPKINLTREVRKLEKFFEGGENMSQQDPFNPTPTHPRPPLSPSGPFQPLPRPGK